MIRLTYFLSFILLTLSIGCNRGLIRPLYFMDGEMDQFRFVHSDSGMKVGPGDVIYVELFEAYEHTNGKSARMVSSYRIPLRIVSDSGSLKDYEKSFLMLVLASGAKNKIEIKADQDSSRNELIKVWNYMVNNLKAVQAPFKRTKLTLIWDEGIAALYHLNNKYPQELIALPRHINSYSYYQYLTGNWANISGPTNSYYLDDDSGIGTPFVHTNYTIEFNGLRYDNRKYFREEGSWALYDWLHCGVFIVDGMREKVNKTVLYKITLKGWKGAFRIVRLSKTHPTYSIRYNENITDTIIWHIADPHYKGRWLKEEELRYIHPAVVRKLKFK
ncbi:MAG: hypothetical protein H7259_05305 [Cytophagales bacterium]|nr:hypothetical protein [Cytophaga sp.]